MTAALEALRGYEDRDLPALLKTFQAESRALLRVTRPLMEPSTNAK